MAAPTRNLFTALTGNTGTNSYVPSLTAQATGAAVGDCICVFVACDGNPTLSLGGTSEADGWELVTQLADATNACKAAYFRFMVMEAGTVPALTISSTASESFVAQAVRIRPAAASALVFIAPTTATGSSTNPNPAAIVNNSGAARDILYCVFWGGDGIVASTAAPTNYANHQSATISNSANGSAIGSADRTRLAVANAGSEDAGVFTRATEQWVAISTAVYQVGIDSVTGNNLTTGSPDLGQPALTQKHVVAGGGVTSAPVLGQPALTQSHALVASNLATAAPALAAPALTQSHALVASNLATAAPVLGSPALSLVLNFTANPLVTAAPVLGSPALTQSHALVANGLATGAPALAAPTLTQRHSVVANALATAAPVLGAPALTQAHVLAAVALATGAPALGAPALTQAHAFTANDLAPGAPVLGSPVLSSGGSTFVANDLVTGAPALGQPALTQHHVLVANSLATGAPVLGSPALALVVSLVANSLATGAPVLGSPVLGQGHAFTANDLAPGSPVLGSPALTQRHSVVANALATAAPVLDAPALLTSIWGDIQPVPVPLPSRVREAVVMANGEVVGPPARDRTARIANRQATVLGSLRNRRAG